jgi:2-polyprenyl-3-methyl-5-hydroxy-6-metoxy-1,4-benzoquinol methylase
MQMPYGLKHWDDPRASIATKHQKNDFAYVSRGANIAMYVLKHFNITPSEAKNMTVLDYGCGTGRAAAFLSLIFGKSVGYDPNPNCIKVAKEENAISDIHLPNLVLTTKINEIPQCDIAFSTNVIEHLNQEDAEVMVNALKLKVKGKSLIWYSPVNNPVLQPYIVSAKWEDRLSVGRIQVDFFDIH